jgi:hypothetical protein
MPRRVYEVVPHPRGWAVKRSDTERPSNVFRSKSAAMDRGRELANTNRAELVVHDDPISVDAPHEQAPRAHDVRH